MVKNIRFGLVFAQIFLFILFANVTLSYSGAGEGTLESPFLLTNCSQLQEINDNLTAIYRMISNIDCDVTSGWNEGAGFAPIGYCAEWDGDECWAEFPFSGDFDGAGFNVTNLMINRPTERFVGLFGYVNGDVHDVGVVDANISGRKDVGVLIGYLSTWDMDKVRNVSNCISSGIVRGEDQVGGLLGSVRGSVFSSHSSAAVSGHNYVGGLVGSYVWYSELPPSAIDLSYATGSVAGGAYVGGLVGSVDGGVVTRSYASGDVTYLSDVVMESGSMGGLVGILDEGNITQSYSSGNVEVSESCDVGGLVGKLTWGNVFDSYSRSNVTGLEEVGGFVGSAYYYGIANSYGTGTVSGDDELGGFAGYSDNIAYSYSYWDNESSGFSTSFYVLAGEVEGRTTAEMWDISNYVGWDFSEIWSDEFDGINYPILQWQNGIVPDSDGDGISDVLDKLWYTESEIAASGTSGLNVTVGGNSTSDSFNSGSYEVVFQDAGFVFMNFTHNFSASELDLSKIKITKTDTSIIVNMSGQVQGNKTIIIADNSFISLCVKDVEIASISEISSGCDGAGELDFTSCLGGTQTTNGIVCTDLGSTIRIDNLVHSAIKGGQAVTPPSSGGGGSGGCVSHWTCTTWGDCINGKQTRICADNSCRRTKGGPAVEQECVCRESWTCEGWSDCSTNGLKTRDCIDNNGCGTTLIKPRTSESCVIAQVIEPSEEEPLASIKESGLILDTDKSIEEASEQEKSAGSLISPRSAGVVLFLMLVFGTVAIFIYKRRKNKD